MDVGEVLCDSKDNIPIKGSFYKQYTQKNSYSIINTYKNNNIT